MTANTHPRRTAPVNVKMFTSATWDTLTRPLDERAGLHWEQQHDLAVQLWTRLGGDLGDLDYETVASAIEAASRTHGMVRIIWATPVDYRQEVTEAYASVVSVCGQARRPYVRIAYLGGFEHDVLFSRIRMIEQVGIVAVTYEG
jgi:hypothetical protein